MALLFIALFWIIQIAIYIIVAQAIMSWLIAFNILNPRSNFVATIWNVLKQITEPIYAPLRNILPPMGGFDLTPMVVIIALIILQNVLANVANGML